MWTSKPGIIRLFARPSCLTPGPFSYSKFVVPSNIPVANVLALLSYLVPIMSFARLASFPKPSGMTFATIYARLTASREPHISSTPHRIQSELARGDVG